VRHYPDKKIYIFMDRRDPREGAGKKAKWGAGEVTGRLE
jgi:hypothetical protein